MSSRVSRVIGRSPRRRNGHAVARGSDRAPARKESSGRSVACDAPVPGVDCFVVIYNVPWAMYMGLVDAFAECHWRHTYDRGTLEMPSVVYGVSWEAYQAFLKATPEYYLRHTYDRGTLEMMSPLKVHEWDKGLIGRLIEQMALELDIGIQTVGSTTFSRAPGRRGLQPDESYYIQHEPLVRGKEDFDPATDPPPDLVVEVDVTRTCLERLPVYATLRVPEVWRYTGVNLTFLGLSPGSKYRELRRSKAFPFLRAADLMRFLDMRHETDENSVIRAFVEWLREKHAKPPAKRRRKKK